MTIAGLLDFTSDIPDMPAASCRRYGMALIFDKAGTGDPEAIERAQAVCLLCPERVPKCAPWAATLSKKELASLGVVAGQVYVAQKPGQDQRTAPNGA